MPFTADDSLSFKAPHTQSPLPSAISTKKGTPVQKCPFPKYMIEL